MLFLWDWKNIFIVLIGAANLFYGSAVYFQNRKSCSNFWFFNLILAIGAWIFTMVFYRGASSAIASEFWANLLYFSATTIPLSFLYFCFVFPSKEFTFSFWQKYMLPIPFLIIAFISLWPNTLIRGVVDVPGKERVIIFNTLLHLLYGFYISFYFLWSYLLLFKKFFNAEGLFRKQMGYIIFGTLISTSIGMTTNLLLPLFNFFQLNWVGQVGIGAMVSFVSYAITQHRLFDIKVIATELLIFAIWAFFLIQTLLSDTVMNFVVNSSLLVLVIFFGTLLIWSVLKEVRLREEIERLAKELEFANKELKRLDQAKSDFISIASHQLRTPLSIIKGYISMIREGSYGEITDRVRKTLNKIYLSNERLVKLVADLLDLSRMESGKLQYEFAEFNMADMVDSTVDEFRIPAGDKKIELLWQKPKVPLAVWGDSWKLRQVVFNLIDNGLKYTEKGSLTLALTKANHTVTLSVKDTGVGMTPETAHKLFQKFVRGKDSFRTHTEGLGLGLFIAKKIIDDHQGKLWAESAGEGKGSAFIIELPTASEVKQKKDFTAFVEGM